MFLDPQENHRKYFIEHGQEIIYKKGQHYILNPNSSPWVYFLTEGLVKISYRNNKRSERLIGFLVPGMTFAQNGLINHDEAGSLEYISVSQTTSYRIPREEFLKQLTADPAFNHDYVQSLLGFQTYLIDRVVYQGEKGIYARCIRWMLFMAKFYGKSSGAKKDTCKILIPLTQETAAQFMHVTRESTSAAYRKLCKKDLITINKKIITIPSVVALKKELPSKIK